MRRAAAVNAVQVFNYIITAVIVINVLVLASHVYNESPAFSHAKETANYAFTAVFVVEAVVKVTGLGWRNYWRNGWNKFDFFLIVMSIIDVGFTQLASHGSQVRSTGSPLALALHDQESTNCRRSRKALGRYYWVCRSAASSAEMHEQ